MIQLISQFKGFLYINPLLTLALTINLFSMAGIPPMIGFFSKIFVIKSIIDSGFFFLALIVILTSVISAVYYVNIVKLMFNNIEIILQLI